MEEEEEDYEEEVREKRRSRQPRFGSFVTIAVALLMLFGAASRMGKLPETAALFDLDNRARDYLRQEDSRSRAIISIGATPVEPSALHTTPGSLPIRPVSQPPRRGDLDSDGQHGRSGRSPMSITIPVDDFPVEDGIDNDGYIQYGTPQTTPPPRSAVAPPPERTTQAPTTYVVREGDTLAKIAQRTLGSSDRWRDIQQANPVTQNGGFRVGLTLVIPQVASSNRR